MIAERPGLTLPEAEAEALALAYGQAETILEYGSGGSTVLAAERARGTIFAVESDAAWLAALQAYFAQNPPRSTVVLHHADIGPTKAWGHPEDRAAEDRWPLYARGVWARPDFRAPDLILVDGRFRLDCMRQAYEAVTRPTTLLVDDYADRPHYHRFETLAGAPEMIGRLARFELDPRRRRADRPDWTLTCHADPR